MSNRSPLVMATLLFVVLLFAVLAWWMTGADARVEFARAAGLTAVVLVTHLLGTPVAAAVAGRIDRRRDPRARAGGVVWAMIAAGFVATAAAAVGVAVLPGPWWAAVGLSGVAAVVATVASWATVPLARPVDQQAAGPEATAVLLPLLLLVPALGVGGLARLLLGLTS